MKKLLVALGVALLMAGCGEPEEERKSPDPEGNASAAPPVVANSAKAPVVDKWAEWEADPEPCGGLEVLAKIRKAKESSVVGLSLSNNKITDLRPLAGLTELKVLDLGTNKITDVTPLAGLSNLEKLFLHRNQITDLAPLVGLTKLETLNLVLNQITDVTPLAGLSNLEKLDLSLQGGSTPISATQKDMLEKALPACKITF